MKKRAWVVPKKMDELRQRLEQWRSTHRQRGRIPESLWAEAAELARQHGVYQTSRALRLEYTRLWYWCQQRRDPAGQAIDKPARTEFVELVTPLSAGQSECVIEWQSERGKITIHLKGPKLPDLKELSYAFWSRP